MLKALRRKFIAVSMASMGAVLALIITIMNLSNYFSMRDTVARRMDIVVSMLKGEDNGFIHDGSHPGDNADGATRPEDAVFDHQKESFGRNPLDDRQKNFLNGGFGRIGMEARFDARYFLAFFDEKGNLISNDVSNIASVDESGAERLSLSAYSGGKTEGRKSDYFFRKITGSYGDSAPENGAETLIFLDMSRELSSFTSYLLISVIVSAAGALLVFLLILMLSKLVMKPVAESYEKQKRFITDASHEIKTPLAIIGANTEVLEMDNGENEWTHSIRRQIGRLTGLTEKLVFLSKMDEEESRLENLLFDISSAIEETADSFDPVVEARGFLLEKNIPNEIMYFGDEERVRQLVSLLLDNAMKYTPKDGKIMITVVPGKEKKVKEAQNGEIRRYRQLKITVFNTADDVAKGNNDILFERFYRTDGSRNSKTGGYGIGLSVVRAIAEAHHGSAHCESVDGKSIEFTIQLN